jgi:hypothetical protein
MRPGARMFAALIGVFVAAACLWAGDVLTESFEGSPDHPAIGYGQPPNDVVAALNRKIQEGSLELTYDEGTGYLRSVLEALHVPVESQIVAIAKTSVQRAIITPQNPRTLYFNDSVAVGFVQGGFIELAAQDPKQGFIFYTLGRNRARPQPFSLQTRPNFRREDGCLQCHLSYATMGVPGALLRSVFPAPGGMALYQAGSYVTDHRSPIAERFGGWYVTGNEGPHRHLGNALFPDPNTAEIPAKGEILSSLKTKLDTRLYLSPYSDIVALMVFDHQMHMMNLLTRIGWEVRYWRREKPEELASRLRVAAEDFVDYLLFVDEAPLDGKIRGSSGFAEEFATRGRRDSKGRSLREFDLERRLFRYPCSYMIYSGAFEALPYEAKNAIYERLWSVLSGNLRDGKYARLSLADRRATVEILRETKSELPDYFSGALIP